MFNSAIPDSSLGFPSKMDQLMDALTPAPQDGEFLIWNESIKQWIPVASITGKAGKFLSTDGNTIFWQNVPGGGDMLRANNLSDLDNNNVARINLGLGTAAIKDVGHGPDNVSPGQHTHTQAEIDGLVDVLANVRRQWENQTPGDGVTVPATPDSDGSEGAEAFDDNFYYLYRGGKWGRIPINFVWTN